MMARVKTRFVVRRGRIGRLLELRLNFRGRGAKIERVPVPVLRLCEIHRRNHDLIRWLVTYRSGRFSPMSRISRIRSRY